MGKKDSPTPLTNKEWINWTTIKINGREASRIKYCPKQGEPDCCEGCRVTKGSYHRWGCFWELMPICKEHKYFVECDCSMERDGEPV